VQFFSSFYLSPGFGLIFERNFRRCIEKQKKSNEIPLNTHEKFWFDCDKCGQQFYIQLNNINSITACNIPKKRDSP
jgi:hypothetical protein